MRSSSSSRLEELQRHQAMMPMIFRLWRALTPIYAATLHLVTDRERANLPRRQTPDTTTMKIYEIKLTATCSSIVPVIAYNLRITKPSAFSGKNERYGCKGLRKLLWTTVMCDELFPPGGTNILATLAGGGGFGALCFQLA